MYFRGDKFSTIYYYGHPSFSVQLRMRFVIFGRSAEKKWKNKTRIIEIGGPIPQDHCDGAWNQQQHMVTKISTVENEGDGRCDNKSKIKGCLWLTCGLIILEMKADNDPAFSLTIYY